MCAPTSGKAVLAPLLPWQSAAAQKTRVEKLILAVNGLCDAPLTRYGHQDGPCTRASRLEVWAPPPVLHGAAWRTRGAEEGAFGTVGYASTILWRWLVASSASGASSPRSIWKEPGDLTTDEAVLERGLVGLTHTGGHHRWMPSNLDRPGDSAEHHADRQQRSKSSTSGGCHQSADTAQVVSCDLVAATAALRVAARAAREGWHPKKPGPLLPTTSENWAPGRLLTDI